MSGSSLVNCAVYVLLKIILESTFYNPVINLFLMDKVENNSKFLLKGFNSCQSLIHCPLDKSLGRVGLIRTLIVLNGYFSRLFFFFFFCIPSLHSHIPFLGKQMFSFLRIKKVVCLLVFQGDVAVHLLKLFIWHYV